MGRNHLLLPPPQGAISPRHATVPTDGFLLRFFNPGGDHPQTALAFRDFGPLNRFDHHYDAGSPAVDPDGRAVWYAASNESTVIPLHACAFECFGHTQLVDFSWSLARPQILEPLDLLDIVDGGAIDAGTIAQVAACEDAKMSRAWARYFYEHPTEYGLVDGIKYRSAWSGAISVMLFERGRPKLQCHGCSTALLNDDLARRELLLLAQSQGWSTTIDLA